MSPELIVACSGVSFGIGYCVCYFTANSGVDEVLLEQQRKIKELEWTIVDLKRKHGY